TLTDSVKLSLLRQINPNKMKNKLLLSTPKSLALLLLVIGTTLSSSYAQGGEAPFVKGSKTIGLALGAGGDYGYVTPYGGHAVSLPAFVVIYDQGIINDA